MPSAKKRAKKSVAKKPAADTAVSAQDLDELRTDGQQCSEALSEDDMSIPFVQILQQLSPQCTKGDPAFLPGAEPSDLYHTIEQTVRKTRDSADKAIEGARIIPIHYRRSYIEWVPRHAGGGFVAEHSAADGLTIATARSENNLDIIQDDTPLGTPGNQLALTHTHFIFLLADDGTFEPAILTMAATQLRASRDLNNMVSRHRLPTGERAARFFAVYSVTTQQRSNDQGSWYVWRFCRVDDVAANPTLLVPYRAAREFLAGIIQGEHVADHARADATADTTDIPF